MKAMSFANMYEVAKYLDDNGLTLDDIRGPVMTSSGRLDFIYDDEVGAVGRTDESSAVIKAPGTVFTAGTIIWSDAVDMRDHREVSVWFMPTNLGTNTSVTLHASWSDDGTTIPFDTDNGIQQTDFLITMGADGTFAPKDYIPTLTTAGGELVANSFKLFSFPKKGGSFRFGVKGNHASGAFGVRAQRLG